MKDIDHVNRLLDEVGKRDAVVGLRLSSGKTAGLKLKNGVEVLFEYVEVSRRLYLYTPLETIAHDDPKRAELYETLLDCNFLNLGCETGALAFFRQTGQAVYQNGFDVQTLTADKLDRAIDALIAQREEALFQLECARTATRQPPKAAPAVSTPSANGTAARLAMRLPQSRA